MSILAIRLLIFILLVSCSSPSVPNQNTVTGSAAVSIGEYLPKLVGDFGDDWHPTLKSANGIILSARYEDEDFIFLFGDDIEPIALTMRLGDSIVSDTFYADTAKRFVEISADSSSVYLQDLTSFNLTQGVVIYSDSAQSYKFFSQPSPLETWELIEIKIKAIIQSVDGRVQVDKIQKVLVYEVN